jgi:predicted AAA+ superfamily ATPase
MIRDIIYDYWDSDLPEMVERETGADIDTELINDIVGIRRSGKTYLMFGVIKELLEKVDKKATIYVNFENRRLLPLTSDYFNQVVSFMYQEKLFERFEKVYLFFDEVQRINEWERFVRSLYDEFRGKLKIFVSGSSANLLSKEYGELLTGRHLTTGVFPLSFREFLKFKGVEMEKRSEKAIAQTRKFLEEYLEFGGFPEIVLQDAKKKKEDMLNQLFGDILSRDILGRTNARKGQIVEEFSYFLSSNISNLLSFGRMAKYFSSRGIKVSLPTLQNYFYLMKNAFLFFDSMVFSYKVKDQLQYPRKIYCVDSGLANLTGFKFSQNIGRMYENTVAVELLRRNHGNPRIKVFYWKNRLGQEVDFVVKDGLKVKQLIQVCFQIEDDETKQRETRSLVHAGTELECNNLLVITHDYDGQEEYDGKKVNYIALWKWLLKQT